MSDPTSKPTVLLVGPHGVVGGAVRQGFTSHPDWDLVTASRRAPAEAQDGGSPRAISVELLDAGSSVRGVAPARMSRSRASALAHAWSKYRHAVVPS